MEKALDLWSEANQAWGEFEADKKIRSKRTNWRRTNWSLPQCWRARATIVKSNLSLCWFTLKTNHYEHYKRRFKLKHTNREWVFGPLFVGKFFFWCVPIGCRRGKRKRFNLFWSLAVSWLRAQWVFAHATIFACVCLLVTRYSHQVIVLLGFFVFPSSLWFDLRSHNQSDLVWLVCPCVCLRLIEREIRIIASERVS